MLWKHVDSDGRAEVRRARRMVVSIHATVANYEYLVYWRFYQDGNIECEVRATGIMVTTPIAEGSDTLADRHAWSISAPTPRSTSTSWSPGWTWTSTGRRTPCWRSTPWRCRSARTTRTDWRWSPRRRRSPRRRESARDFNWETPARLEGGQPEQDQRHGHPVGYKLVPGRRLPGDDGPGAPLFLRAPVMGHTLWVTAHHDDEKWPAGDYPTQRATDDGLTEWIAD